MAIYAIGDVQGCYDCLKRLLDKIRFDPGSDRLWFTGDLVNRGPRSADVVRLIVSFGDRAITVLGNHDLHLLAVGTGAVKASTHDTFRDVLQANDSKSLLTWIASCPLFHHDAEVGFSLTHAGLLPQWSISDASRLAREAEAVIRRPDAPVFFKHMYGEEPDCWNDALTGWDRLRLIVNAFTRVRFCSVDGRMNYRLNGPPGTQTSALLPWFQIPWRRSRDERIVFGHWSSLGLWNRDGVIGLDTGCVWGRQLTAARLDQEPPEFLTVSCDDCHGNSGG